MNFCPLRPYPSVSFLTPQALRASVSNAFRIAHTSPVGEAYEVRVVARERRGEGVACPQYQRLQRVARVPRVACRPTPSALRVSRFQVQEKPVIAMLNFVAAGIGFAGNGQYKRCLYITVSCGKIRLLTLMQSCNHRLVLRRNRPPSATASIKCTVLPDMWSSII